MSEELRFLYADHLLRRQGGEGLHQAVASCGCGVHVHSKSNWCRYADGFGEEEGLSVWDRPLQRLLQDDAQRGHPCRHHCYHLLLDHAQLCHPYRHHGCLQLLDHVQLLPCRHFGDHLLLDHVQLHPCRHHGCYLLLDHFQLHPCRHHGCHLLLDHVQLHPCRHHGCHLLLDNFQLHPCRHHGCHLLLDHAIYSKIIRWAIFKFDFLFKTFITNIKNLIRNEYLIEAKTLNIWNCH